MLIVCKQQHSFWTHERVQLCDSVKVFETENVSIWVGLETPNLWIHAECSNLLSYQGQTSAVPIFLNTGSRGVDIFEVKLTLEMFTVRGQQH